MNFLKGSDKRMCTVVILFKKKVISNFIVFEQHFTHEIFFLDFTIIVILYFIVFYLTR